MRTLALLLVGCLASLPRPGAAHAQLPKVVLMGDTATSCNQGGASGSFGVSHGQQAVQIDERVTRFKPKILDTLLAHKP